MKQQTLSPSCYPPRAPVKDPGAWNDLAYMPPEFEAGVLHQASKPVWAEHAHVYDQMKSGERVCYDETTNKPCTVLLECHFDQATQRFKNPKGKTGIRGQGELGRWGPNHAADVIVTRTMPDGTQAGSSSASAHPHALFGSLFASGDAEALIGGPDGYQAALQAAQIREAILRIELQSIENHWEREHGERRLSSRDLGAICITRCPHLALLSVSATLHAC